MDLARSLLAILGACLFISPNVQAADPTSVNAAVPAPAATDQKSALIEHGKYVALIPRAELAP